MRASTYDVSTEGEGVGLQKEWSEGGCVTEVLLTSPKIPKKLRTSYMGGCKEGQRVREGGRVEEDSAAIRFERAKWRQEVERRRRLFFATRDTGGG